MGLGIVNVRIPPARSRGEDGGTMTIPGPRESARLLEKHAQSVVGREWRFENTKGLLLARSPRAVERERERERSSKEARFVSQRHASHRLLFFAHVEKEFRSRVASSLPLLNSRVLTTTTKSSRVD